MKFYYSTAPKFDFLLVSGAATAPLAPDLAALQPQTITEATYTAHIFGFPQRVRTGDILFSGTRYLAGFIERGPTILNQAPTECGEWASVTLGADMARVSSDPYGRQPLYIGHGMVSNRLHLIAEQLAHENRFTIDAVAAIQPMIFRSAFSWQQSTWETVVDGVALAQVGEQLLVGRNLAVEANPMPRPSDLGPETYWSLIERAADEVVNNVVAATNSFRSVQAALTGGRDSRVVYAAIIAAGLTDRIRFVTNDIGQDLRIATGLMARFGGTFKSDGPAMMIASAPDASLDRFNSHKFFCDLNWNRSVHRPNTYHSEDNFCLLGGGSGEIYRGLYYGRVFDGMLDYAEFEPEAFRHMALDRLRRTGWIAEDKRDKVAAQLTQTFCNLPGATVGDRLDAHFLSFRNRYHFGQTIPRLPKGTVSPLLSPSLFAAAALLPKHERIQGRALFDVTRHLCEELAYVEYDQELPAYWDMAFHKPSRFDGQYIALDPTPAKSLPGPRAGRFSTPMVKDKYNALPFASQYLKSRHRLGRATQIGEYLSPKFWKMARSLPGQDGKPLYKWVAMVAMCTELEDLV